MKIVVIAVNDDVDARSKLATWGRERVQSCVVKEGSWATVGKELDADFVLLVLSEFWPNWPAFRGVFDQAKSDVAFLFLFDSSIAGQEENVGEKRLAKLLSEFQGEWWGAILSGKPSQESDTTIRAQMWDVANCEAVCSAHYLGASQYWFEDSKSLITQVLERSRRPGGFEGWKPHLHQLPVDVLGASIHRLLNDAAPISNDAFVSLGELLKKISLDAEDQKTVAEILEDYFSNGEAAYLTSNSKLHHGGNLETLLDAEGQRLKGILREDEKIRVDGCFQEIKVMLQTKRDHLPSREDCLEKSRTTAEDLRQRIGDVANAIREAVKELETIRERHRKESHESKTSRVG